MTSTTLSPDRLAAGPDSRTFVGAAAIVGAVGCAGYISTIVLLGDQPVRDAARSPLTIVSNILVAVAFAALAASLPLLAAQLRLPRWAGLLGGVGCALVAATSWGTGTLAVHAAGLLDEAQMEETSGWLVLFQSPQALPCAVAYVALGLAVVRTRAAARGAGVLLVVAGVVSLLPAYPPGALLAALAVMWTARTATP